MTDFDHAPDRRKAIGKFLEMGALVTGAGLLPGAVAQAIPTNAHQHSAHSLHPPFEGYFDVRRFGAKGDARALDTRPINDAIAAAARSGGGVVHFPAGVYRTFSIRLKSNVSLDLAPGSTILGAEPSASGGYDAPEPGPGNHYEDYGHRHWQNALIWGVGLENVSISGPGLVYGKGLLRTMGGNPVAGHGDKCISLKNCNRVTLRDFSILHGGHFGILATGVDNLTMDNLKLDTDRDGMDIDCCKNVRLSNLTVNSPWDDAIVLKSSFALGFARSTENVAISNCWVTGKYQQGTLLDGTFKPFPPGARVAHTGRIKIGTESNGGFKNIVISNCIFEHCDGLALETVDGARLEDVALNNITMRDIAGGGPIFLRLGARMRGPAASRIGQLRRVNISNVVVSNSPSANSSVLSGIPGHPIEDVRLNNITIVQQGGGTAEEARRKLPELESGYPEPWMFGPTPAFGFYVRHVKGLSMSNIEIQSLQPDARPAFVLDDVSEADFIHVKAPRGLSGHTFALSNVEEFGVHLSRPVADAYYPHATSMEL